MTEETGVTIKFGPGYEAPWYTPKGTTEELSAKLDEAFGGLSGKTLAERIVEASRRAQGLYAGSKLGKDGQAAERAKDAAWQEASATVTKKAAPKGIAAQAKEADSVASVATPPQATDIAGEIKAATTAAAITAIYKKYQNNGWGDEHKALASAKRLELKESK